MVLARMPSTGKSPIPYLLLTGLIAIWAGTFVVSKNAMGVLTPFALVAARFLIGALCILPLFLFSSKAQRRGTLGPGLLAGTMLAIPYFLQMYGVRETTASMGGFVTGLIVLLVAVGGHFCFGARIGKLAFVGLAFGLGGIVTLCLSGDAEPATLAVGEVLVRHNSVRGILLQVGSAFGFATHILLLSHYGSRLAVVPFTFVQLAFAGAVAAIAAAAVTGASVDGNAITWSIPLLLSLGYLGVLATGMAIAIQANVQHKIPSAHVALLFALQPLFAAIIGWACQDDRLEAMQWIGGALIVTGVLIASRDRVSDRAS